MASIVGIDFSVSGAMVLMDKCGVILSQYDIPNITEKTLVSRKRVAKDGYYKNGKQKYKTTKPAKYKIKKTFDLLVFSALLESIIEKDKNTLFVIEKQNGRAGNSASSSSTITFNYGQAIGALKILNVKYTEVLPARWKKDLGIQDGKLTYKEKKIESVKIAMKIFKGETFKRDDHAEAALIAHWATL